MLMRLSTAISGQKSITIPHLVKNETTPPKRPRNVPSIPVAHHNPPAPPLHVKWKGCEEAVEASGERCLLCKRDLSFTAQREVYQPTAPPPPAALLPCGHTFHDHCLHKITPQDQLNDPPCIPCAINGET